MKDYDKHLLGEIVNFAQTLVRIPSQAYEDSLDDIFESISVWLNANGIPWRPLTDSSEKIVAILITIDSNQPGPTICLDACVDTASIGSLELWNVDPFSGSIIDEKLYGRGVADSKVAVAIFCHLVREVLKSDTLKSGVLYILLDGDEHTGNFGGVKSFIESSSRLPTFVAIGYPGNDKMMIGARGFYRTIVRVFGKEIHSGSSKANPSQNAIVKMAGLVEHISQIALPKEEDQDFLFGPSVNFTEITGGAGFSQIPGSCEAKIDIRLTPGFNTNFARKFLLDCINYIDTKYSFGRITSFTEVETWPPYKLQRDANYVQILHQCAEEIFSKNIELAVCGPSNIGNYLATKDIPATCGFGVTYENIHGPNECVYIASVLPTYFTYWHAIQRLLMTVE